MRAALLLLCLLILMSGWSPSLYAQESPPTSLEYPKRLLNDLRDLPAQPLDFSKTQWMLTGGVAAATLTALAYDGEMRGDVRQRRNEYSDHLSLYSTPFGDYRYQVPLHAYLWSLGTVSNFSPLKKSAADGLEASFLSAGLITPLITKISGRALPSYNERPLEFHPFILKRGHESFPSGHTTEAFAMASVLDEDFRGTFGYWHTPFLFALAAGTGFSRIYDDKHYLSDVILATGIGTSIGYWVADKQRNAPSSISLWPTPGGFVMAWQF